MKKKTATIGKPDHPFVILSVPGNWPILKNSGRYFFMNSVQIESFAEPNGELCLKIAAPLTLLVVNHANHSKKNRKMPEAILSSNRAWNGFIWNLKEVIISQVEHVFEMKVVP